MNCLVKPNSLAVSACYQLRRQLAVDDFLNAIGRERPVRVRQRAAEADILYSTRVPHIMIRGRRQGDAGVATRYRAFHASPPERPCSPSRLPAAAAVGRSRVAARPCHGAACFGSASRALHPRGNPPDPGRRGRSANQGEPSRRLLHLVPRSGRPTRGRALRLATARGLCAGGRAFRAGGAAFQPTACPAPTTEGTTLYLTPAPRRARPTGRARPCRAC